MKHCRLLSALALLAFAAGPSILRGDGKDDLAPTVAPPPPPTNLPISQEFDVEGAYLSPSEFKQGRAHDVGPVDNTYGHANYVVSPEVKDGLLLRFGVDAERNSFGLPASNAVPLPNTLQSVNAVIGADFVLSDKILLRAELHPGIYSDFVHIGGDDFDMPVQVGGTYLYSKDFQIIFGVQIDLKSNYPVIGLPGFRWQFADKWVLDAIPPKPQLEYELTDKVTLYTGANLIGGTYHLNDTFGSYHGHQGPNPNTNNSQLNNNIVDYDEVRLGVGVMWKFNPNVSLDVSGGYVPFREYDIHPDHIGYDVGSTTFKNDLGSGGYYSEVGIKGSF